MLKSTHISCCISKFDQSIRESNIDNVKGYLTTKPNVERVNDRLQKIIS